MLHINLQIFVLNQDAKVHYSGCGLGSWIESNSEPSGTSSAAQMSLVSLDSKNDMKYRPLRRNFDKNKTIHKSKWIVLYPFI